MLVIERNTNHYAVDRERVTSLCYELHNHSEATEQNKEHFKELQSAAYDMARGYQKYDPFKSLPDLYKWCMATIKRDDITSPLDWLIAKRFKEK